MSNPPHLGWKEAYVPVAYITGTATLKMPHDQVMFLDDESMKDYSTFRTNLGRFDKSFTGVQLTTTYYDSDNDELPMDSECEFNEAMRIVKDRTKRGQHTLLHVTPALHNTALYAQERRKFVKSKKQTAVFIPCSSRKNDYSKIGRLTNESKHESKESEEPPAWFINYMDKFKEEILSNVKNIVSGGQSVRSEGVSKDGELPKHNVIPDENCIKSVKIVRDDVRDSVSTKLDPTSEGHLLRKIEKLHKREKKLERKVDIKLEKMEQKAKRKMEKKTQKLQQQKENVNVTKDIDLDLEMGCNSYRPCMNARIYNAWTNDHIPCGSQFVQVWHVKNNGCAPWTAKTELRLVACQPGLLPESSIIKCPILDVGEKGRIIVKFQEAVTPGCFVSIWHLYDHGKPLGHLSFRCGIVVVPDVETNKNEEQVDSKKDAQKVSVAGNTLCTVSYPETDEQQESVQAAQEEPSAPPSAQLKVQLTNEALKENSVIGYEVKPEKDKEPNYKDSMYIMKISHNEKAQCDGNGEKEDNDGGNSNKVDDDDNNKADAYNEKDEDIHDDEISILSGEISITESDSDESQDSNSSKFVVVPMPSCFNTNEHLSGHSNAESFINVNGNADAETGESSKQSISTATTQKQDSSTEMPLKSQVNSTVYIVDSLGRCLPINDMNTKQSNSKRSAAACAEDDCSSEVDQGINDIKDVKISTLEHSGCCCDTSGTVLKEKMFGVKKDHGSYTLLPSKELKVGQGTNPSMRDTTAGKCGSSAEICESTKPNVSPVAKKKCECILVDPENLAQEFKKMGLMINEGVKELPNKEKIAKKEGRQEQGCQTPQEVKRSESLATMAKILEQKQAYLTTNLSAEANSVDEPVIFLPEKLVNIAASAISTACNVLGSLGKPQGLSTEQEPRASQLPQLQKQQAQLYADGQLPGIPLCGEGVQGLQYFSGSHGLYPGLYLRGSPVSASNAKDVHANMSHMRGPQFGWEYPGYVYPGQMFSNEQQSDNHMRADYQPGDKRSDVPHPFQINVGGNQSGQQSSNKHDTVKQIQSQPQPSQQYLEHQYFRSQNLTPQLSGQGQPLMEFTGSNTPTRPCYLVPYEGSPTFIPSLNHSVSPRLGVFNPTSVSQTPSVPTLYSDHPYALPGHNNKSVFAGNDSHSDQSKPSHRFDFMSGRDLNNFDGNFKAPETSSQVKIPARQNSAPMQPSKCGQSEIPGSHSGSLL